MIFANDIIGSRGEVRGSRDVFAVAKFEISIIFAVPMGH